MQKSDQSATPEDKELDTTLNLLKMKLLKLPPEKREDLLHKFIATATEAGRQPEPQAFQIQQSYGNSLATSNLAVQQLQQQGYNMPSARSSLSYSQQASAQPGIVGYEGNQCGSGTTYYNTLTQGQGLGRQSAFQTIDDNTVSKIMQQIPTIQVPSNPAMGNIQAVPGSSTLPNIQPTPGTSNMQNIQTAPGSSPMQNLPTTTTNTPTNATNVIRSTTAAQSQDQTYSYISNGD